MKPIAIVIPWCGRNLKGGAEQQAWQMAERLAARGRTVEVLTTCCRSHNDDWGVNHLPAGITKEPEGFSIRRFPVQPRYRAAANRVLHALETAPKTSLKPGVSPISNEDAALFSQLIHSPKLLSHLERKTAAYRAFIFISCLYGPILDGLPLVASKAWLQPCLRDESCAYLPPVAAIFHQARGILFNNVGEFELAIRLYGPGIIPKSVVVGGGVKAPDVAEAAGRANAAEDTDWRKVLDCFEKPLFETDGPASGLSGRVSSGNQRAVHQVLPSLSFGDAISNYVCWVRDILRSRGLRSEIFSLHSDERMASERHAFSPQKIRPEDAVLYHHAIGSELTAHMAAHPGPKCLIYHNITPADFFEPFSPHFAGMLRQGREELRLLAKAFPVSVGVSEYNAGELRDAGFANPSVLPLAIEPAHWDLPADARLMDQLKAGHTNLLFVGRLAPHKRQDDLLRVFRAYLGFDPNAVLHLVGSGAAHGDPYFNHLAGTAFSLGLHKRVNFAGHLSGPQLAACYRTAHLFWSMSEHEGFCVPLIEAMWHDVPVLAYSSSAIPETLGEAGVMFTTKDNEDHLAALAWLLVHDSDLRRKVIAAQRRRRACFLPSVVAPQLLTLINSLIGPAQPTPQAGAGTLA